MLSGEKLSKDHFTACFGCLAAKPAGSEEILGVCHMEFVCGSISRETSV